MLSHRRTLRAYLLAVPSEIEQRFVTIEPPEHEQDPNAARVRWRIDAGFLTSGYECIWGRGCQGIHDEERPELMDGCCSVGVVLADDDEAMAVAALGAVMDPAVFQHAGQELLDPRGTRWATRVVDGACVFLNRPGFPAGAGCALHLAAVADGDDPEDWKPQTCNRVPIRVTERRVLGVDGAAADDAGTDDAGTDDAGAVVEVTVRAWRRDDWGPGGATMAWWCTEAPEAFGATSPFVERAERTLRDLMGDAAYDRLVSTLRER
jgi:hypothetical protein